MNKKYLSLMGTALIILGSLFTSCQEPQDVLTYTFNLNCAPYYSNDMEIYMNTYDNYGFIEQIDVGKISDNSYSFSQPLSSTIKYVYFLLMEKDSSNASYYGSVALENNKLEYDFSGYWFYNYDANDTKLNSTKKIVAMSEGYFEEPTLPLSEKFDESKEYFHAYKIFAGKDNVLKISYTDNNNCMIYYSKEPLDFYDSEISSNLAKTISATNGSFLIKSEGEPVYIYVCPIYCFDKESASISYKIEDMSNHIQYAYNIHTVYAHDKDGFYFSKIVEENNVEQPSNILYYYNISTDKVKTIAEFENSISGFEKTGSNAYVASGNKIYLLNLSSKTANVVYSAEESETEKSVIKQIKLLDNNKKILVASVVETENEAVESFDIYSVADFSKITEKSIPTSTDNNSIVSLPNTKFLIWKNNSEPYKLSYGFGTSFDTFKQSEITSEDNSVSADEKYFAYGNQNKLLTSSGNIFTVTDSEIKYSTTLKIKDKQNIQIDDVLFDGLFFYTIKTTSDMNVPTCTLEKRSVAKPKDVIASTEFSGAYAKALYKNSNNEIVVIANTPDLGDSNLLSDKMTLIITQSFDESLKNVTTKANKLVYSTNFENRIDLSLHE